MREQVVREDNVQVNWIKFMNSLNVFNVIYVGVTVASFYNFRRVVSFTPRLLHYRYCQEEHSKDKAMFLNMAANHYYLRPVLIGKLQV